MDNSLSLQSVRIQEVCVQDFRGVRGSMRVSCTDRAGRPVSVLISGDNGTGKSSLVDAIEWACQGSQRQGTAGHRLGMLVNLASSVQQASAEVTLSNGDVILRKVMWAEESGFTVHSTGSRGMFDRAPMLLKRFDILRLLETGPSGRGVLFLHHRLSEDDAEGKRKSRDVSIHPDDIQALKRRSRELAARLAASLGVEVDVSNAQGIDQLIKEHVYRGFSPTQAKRLNIRVADEHQSLVDQIRAAQEKASELKKLSRGVQKKTVGKAEVRVRQLSQLLQGVDEWLTSAFLEVTRASHVKAIEVKFAQAGVVSIEFSCLLANGRRVEPTDLFSEGYQDLIAFLFFLAVLREAAKVGQPKVLLLDDVFQSVDASIRVAVMDLVAKEFSDWQLFFTVHDRLWKAQVAEVLKRASHPFIEVSLADWDFSSGARILDSSLDPSASLRVALDGGDSAAVSALAGRLLEAMSDRMSWTLRTSIQRTRGDKYTLADLWPGVAKALKRLGLSNEVEYVDRWRHLRNMSGAHYNEWADSVPWSDARQFGLSVISLLEALRCEECQSWIEGPGTPLSCRCGALCLPPQESKSESNAPEASEDAP
jgi:recombinational DNA repair ATPase RecF